MHTAYVFTASHAKYVEIYHSSTHTKMKKYVLIGSLYLFLCNGDNYDVYMCVCM